MLGVADQIPITVLAAVAQEVLAVTKQTALLLLAQEAPEHLRQFLVQQYFTLVVAVVVGPILLPELRELP